MSAGAIPMSEILAYFQVHDIDDPEDQEEWVRWIRALDDVFLEHHRKAVETETKKNQAKQKRR